MNLSTTQYEPLPITREACAASDKIDPLACYRERFLLPRDVIYLDGNSLGPVPLDTISSINHLLVEQWGLDLIKGWEVHHWMKMPYELGNDIGRLLGAGPGQVVVSDTTSINIFKLLSACLQLRPGRTVVLADKENFPTDLYMAQGLGSWLGSDRCELRLVENESELIANIDQRTAVVMFSHVNFKTGRIVDVPSLVAAAHRNGALVLSDLCHSAGAIPVALDESEVDMAVGCGYKYLNAGPGSPAFLYVAKRHLESFHQPLWGWLGHQAPFEFSSVYQEGEGIKRAICSSPGILGMTALRASINMWLTVDMQQVRWKSITLCDLFISRVEEKCGRWGFELVSPRSGNERGSQVSFAHPFGQAISLALRASGVIGDFRKPNVLRCGFAPLYIRFVDVWDAVTKLADIMGNDVYKEERFSEKPEVS